jgi:hypothetical protein
VFEPECQDCRNIHRRDGVVWCIAATIHICKGSGVHSCISDEVNNVALSRVQYFTLAFMKMFIRDGVHS